MPIYLLRAAYRPEGAKGLLKEGGTKRRAVIQKMVEAVGGRLHAFYFAFGDEDVVSIVEFPDHVSAAAVSLAISAAGSVKIHNTVLITPEEIDAATKKSVAYRAPGA
jgi:uncharacterized protein with GYD domain